MAAIIANVTGGPASGRFALLGRAVRFVEAEPLVLCGGCACEAEELNSGGLCEDCAEEFGDWLDAINGEPVEEIDAPPLTRGE